MTVIKQTITNLVGGVTQQNPLMRRENQCEAQTNCWNDIVKGMRKRPNTVAIGQITLPASPEGATYYTHTISDEERYLMVVTAKEFKVFNMLTAAEVTVEADSLDYLANANSHALMTIGDDVLVLNPNKTTSMNPRHSGSAGANDVASRRWEIKQATGMPKSGYTITVNGTAYKGFGSARTTTTTPPREVWARPLEDAIKLIGILQKEYPTERFMRIGPYITWSGKPTTQIIVNSAQPQWLDLLEKGTKSIAGTRTYGLAYIVQADYNVSYKLIVTVDGKPKTFSHKTPSATSSGARDKVNTDTILTALTDEINKDKDLPVSASLYSDNCLLFTPKAGTAEDGWSVKADDSLDGKAFVAFRNAIRSEGDLPPDAPEGYYVEIVNKSGENSYHMEYTLSDTGDGYWKETVHPEVDLAFDAATMPHIMRRVFDATGTPKFTFEPYEWAEREVGDDDTAPAPSFIGRPISAMSLTQGRLVFVAGNDVSMSEVNADNNFWATTAVTLVDSDPIDISLDCPEALDIKAITNDNEVLILWDNNVQMGLQFDGVTWTANEVSKYNVDTSLTPTRIGSMFYYSGVGIGRGQVGAYYRVRDQLYESMDTTAHVPTYIPDRLKYITGNSVDSYVMACSAASKELYVYNYRQQGQDMVQAAWSTWTMNGPVYYINDVGSRLYLVVEREGDFRLEYIDLQTTEPVMLDCVMKTSTPPTQLLSGQQTVKYKGDYYTGWTYAQDYVFSPFYPRVNDVPQTDAPLMLRKVELEYANTVGFTLNVGRNGKYKTKDLKMVTGLPAVMGGVKHKDGRFSMVVKGDARNLKLFLTNDTPYDCNILSCTWTGAYHKRTG